MRSNRHNLKIRKGVDLAHIAAFTAVEVAIVLVVAGLILSGVLLGTDMIHNSYSVRVIKEHESWQVVIKSFYDRYEDLPGDMMDATSYWSGATNGDGNGQLVWAGGEGPQAWYQLEQSGLVPGYGLTGTSTSDIAVIGTNVPQSDANSAAGWYVNYSSPDNYLGFGAADGVAQNDGAALRAAQAERIDSKMDDAVSNTGRIQAVGGATCHSAGVYALSGGSENAYTCSLIFTIMAGAAL